MKKREAKAPSIFDCVALGEVMLRFDPGDTRVSSADSFRVWEGGAEYNAIRGLSSCFGKRCGVITALVDNGIGRLIERRMKQGGVDTSLIRWQPDDGIGESRRNGIYFLERGHGLRAASGTMDRGNSAISQVRPGEIDFEFIFGECGAKWLHTGGIMAGLSAISPEVVLEAIAVARRHGAVVSYDLNYRASLWKRFGGKKKAEEVNNRIVKEVDFLFGIESLPRPPQGLETDLFKEAIENTLAIHPHLKVIASTMRCVRSASVNDWGGLLWHDNRFYEGPHFTNLEIYDRVGGGDGFAAGLIYGLLENLPGQKTIDYAVAHGALTMTTPGDNSMMTLVELDQFLENRDVSVQR